MKNVIRAAIVAVAMRVVGAAGASAQLTDTIHVEPTFPVTTGNTTFPAGSFTIKPVEPRSSRPQGPAPRDVTTMRSTERLPTWTRLLIM